MSSKVANSSDCINVQPDDEAPINEITLDEERNNISIMIQTRANISTIFNSIKILIERANKDMNRDWDGELQFNVFSRLNEELLIKNCIQLASHKNLLNKKEPNYYFCTQTYASHDGFDGTAFQNLSKDIHEASLQTGYGITRNGLNRKIKGKILFGARFKCKRCQPYRGNAHHHQTLEYKKTSYNNNQSNKWLSYDPNDPSVKLKLTRRRDTTLAIDKNQTYPFSVTISYNEVGFCVVNGMKLYSRESYKYIRHHLHRTITTYNGTKLNTNGKTITFFERNNISYVMLLQSPEIS